MKIEDLSNKLTQWLQETILKAGSKGAVLGISGGIDSSVVAVLCKQAFPESTLGIIMPCHSNKTDQEHAQVLAAKFHINTRIIILNKPYDELLKILPDSNSDVKIKRLAEANIKSRLRMTSLYYFANFNNYLVIGTSNKSEISTGYFTKYGDSGVDLMPIANLVKKQVRELAEYLKIPRVIIDKPPSAGLWEGQTDEDELGITYNNLDTYLTTGRIESHFKEKIDIMMKRSAHKRLFPSIPPQFLDENL
jgi:NAD+ synthase